MTNTSTTDAMNRGDFLRSLGLSSAALMAFYCMGTLTACSGSDDPAPLTSSGTNSTGLTGNAQTSRGAIDFSLDLNNSDFQSLKTQGSFVKVGDVLVANAKGGKFVAIQRLCTHQAQDQVSYVPASDDFRCSAHGSVYALDGSVKVAADSGQSAMKSYKTTLSADGNKLQVTA